MLLSHVFERFVEKTPFAVMARSLLERTLTPEALDALFEESPSLRRLVGPELLEACYQRAAERIAAEYRVETPARCPFSEQEVLVELVS